jgi:hypothetical protein
MYRLEESGREESTQCDAKDAERKECEMKAKKRGRFAMNRQQGCPL